MWKPALDRVAKSDWPIIGISVIVLLVFVYYMVSFVFFTTYPGITFTGGDFGWQINDSVQAELEVDDVLVKIDSLSFDTYQ